MADEEKNQRKVPREWLINIPSEGVKFYAMCSEAGEKRYRLESLPGFVETIGYHDTFLAEQIGEELRLIRIEHRARRKSFSFAIPKNKRELESLNRILGRIEELGGIWEMIFGGALFVSMPSYELYDPTDDILSI